MGPDQFQQIEGAYNVGLNKSIGIHDRTVYMGFGRKMTDGIDFMGIKEFGHRSRIANIGFNEDVLRRKFGCDIHEVFGVSGIGQLIDIDNAALKILPTQHISDKIAADKPAASGD
jgi:hypothetical protein